MRFLKSEGFFVLYNKYKSLFVCLFTKFACVVFFHFPEAFAQKCSVKMVFLKISLNSRENTCAGVTVGFPVDFLKFARTAVLIELLRWMLLTLSNFIS